MDANPLLDLQTLARSRGVQLEYTSMDGKPRPAPAGSLIGVLRALGVDIARPEDAAEALRKDRLDGWRRGVDPVVVDWDGEGADVTVRLPERLGSAPLKCRLETESGEAREWWDRSEPKGAADVEGERFVARRVQLPEGLEPGYHDLTIGAADPDEFAVRVIAAPRRSFGDPSRKTWGVFCPLYALHRGHDGRSGDLSDLASLMDWTAGLGGGLVATLPMLASNFDGPSPIISPYSPTSRLFWNEFYLDLEKIPGYSGSVVDFPGETANPGLVEYGPEMRRKRGAIEPLAVAFFEAGGGKSPEFREFLGRYPNAMTYAAFQAAGERLGRDWRRWPRGSAEGDHPDDQAPIRYHLFAQFQVDRQLRELSESAKSKGMTWYLDFPVGVDFNSYDVHRFERDFATGASVGCPPDPVFTRGQMWGFPPLDPEKQRLDGYRYLIASFRNHLRYAGALRIDHVMGLHRLFWIPTGAEAKDGAFVSNRSEEIYAILSVESHRHEAWLVGEDLGTVPPEVEGALTRHNVRGMYVMQYEVKPDPEKPFRDVPESTVASVNTHDMPPFAAFWEGLDLDDRLDLGLLPADQLDAERATREAQKAAVVAFLKANNWMPKDAPIDDARAVLRGLWDWLAASPTSVLLLNLEDLWLETESQNTPNTFDERPNWQRKLRLAFDRFADDPTFLAMLRDVDRHRRG